MKRYNQYTIALLMFCVISLTSCLEDEDLLDGLQNGALVNAPGTVEFVLGTSTSVSYELDVQQNNPGDVTSVSVFKQITVDDNVSNEVQVGTFNTFPSNVDLDVTALLSGLEISGNSIDMDALDGDDSMVFRYEITMNDGRILNPLNSTVLNIEE